MAANANVTAKKGMTAAATILISKHKPNQMSRVSIIVPCYNEEKTIRLLLQSLLDQTFPVNEMEVIISDGNSTDHTLEIINQFRSDQPQLKVKVVANPKRNIPSALNAAIKNADGEYIVRLDAHSVPSANYVELCIADLIAGKGDNVGGVWDIRPSNDSMMAKCISIAASHRLGVGDARYRYTTDAAEVDTVPFGSFHRSLFERVGTFDESLLTNEDYELNVRIRNSGGKVWLNPAIRAVYFSRSNLSTLAVQYWRYGLWKWRMLRSNLKTLRWRQALPPVFVLSLLFLFFLAIFFPIFWTLLGIETGLYFATIFVGTIPESLRTHDIRIGIGVGAAIITMHISWGAGFLWSMVKSMFGR
jgi:succinoglycan biosynthesis protein ExoA